MLSLYCNLLKKRTLSRDVTIGLVTILISVIFVITIINYFISVTSAESVLEKSSKEKITQLSHNLSMPVWNFHLKDISNIISGYTQSEDISGIRVTFTLGETVEKFSEIYDPGDKVIKSDILHDSTPVGTVEMFISYKNIISLKIKLLIVSLLTMVSVIFALLFAVRYLLQRFLNTPMKGLMEGLNTISKGAYGIHVEPVVQQDLNLVIDKVNLMSDQIASREKEINTVKNYLNTIISSMPSVIITFNQIYIINLWNTEASRMAGLSEADACGKNLWTTLPFISKYQDSISDVFNTHIPRLFQRQEIPGREGMIYDIFFYPISTENINDIVIRIDNTTEVEHEREQLRQMQKMETIGTLAGGLAHDFNNILGGISGPVSLLQYQLLNEKLNLNKLTDYLRIIDDSTNRAASIVKQLLSLSRKQEIEIVPVDLNTTIKHILNLCINSFDKSIVLNSRLPDVPAMIMADPYQIEQVLLNICINASHALTIMRKETEKTGGVIDISIDTVYSIDEFIHLHPEARQGYYHVISIKDDGTGISKRNLTKIFDPFFSTKEQGKGTGLGLSMAYSIVKQHDGFIDVYSEEGLGTAFNIYFPVSVLDTAALFEVDKNREIKKGTGLILVCDDDSVMRIVAERILHQCGYEVILTSNGEECLEIFRQRHSEISAVLLDTIMPKLSGAETLTKIKEIDAGAKVLIASGFTSGSQLDSIKQSGVKHFIQKPYNLIKLSEAIYEVIYEVVE